MVRICPNGKVPMCSHQLLMEDFNLTKFSLGSPGYKVSLMKVAVVPGGIPRELVFISPSNAFLPHTEPADRAD